MVYEVLSIIQYRFLLNYRTPERHTATMDQDQRAFQKQPTVFLNSKALREKGGKPKRHIRKVGLGFKTPREAIEGTYIDKKCPFTGDVSIRGRILTGVIQKLKMIKTVTVRRDYLHYIKKCPFTGDVSIRGRILTGVIQKLKMNKTVTVRRDYLHYIKKYNRFEKRHRMMSVHLSPCFRDVRSGDIATIGECRPLSKTVRFNVLKVSKAPGPKKQFTKF